jgi:hypothetical protein
MDCEPLALFKPDQSPLAVQEVGELVTLQVTVGLTTVIVPVAGFALMVTTGTAQFTGAVAPTALE